MEKLCRRVHFAAIVVIGVQVLVWTGTGFAFTFFDFQDVRGNYERAERPESLEMSFDLPMARVALGNRLVTEARCKRVAGRPVIEFRTPEGPVLVEGDRIISPLKERDAVAVATRAVKEAPAIRCVERQTDKVAEYGMELPAWRVEFEDAKDTTIYVSPTTGEVLARRNRKWRQFDFLWSLHVMGYIDRSNPANWPLRVTGGLALVAVLSGIGIAVSSLRRKHA
jgi:hypothetical protein